MPTLMTTCDSILLKIILVKKGPSVKFKTCFARLFSRLWIYVSFHVVFSSVESASLYCATHSLSKGFALRKMCAISGNSCPRGSSGEVGSSLDCGYREQCLFWIKINVTHSGNVGAFMLRYAIAIRVYYSNQNFRMRGIRVYLIPGANYNSICCIEGNRMMIFNCYRHSSGFTSKSIHNNKTIIMINDNKGIVQSIAYKANYVTYTCQTDHGFTIVSIKSGLS